MLSSLKRHFCTYKCTYSYFLFLALFFCWINSVSLCVDILDKSRESDHKNYYENNKALYTCAWKGPFVSALDINFGVVITAFFAAVTAIATVFIAEYTRTLQETTRKHISHNQEVERAYVSGGGFRRHQQTDDPNVVTVTSDFVFTVQNYGKTPGYFEGYSVFFCDITQLPIAPAYLAVGHRMIEYIDTIPPNGPLKTIKVFPNVLRYPNPIAYGRFWYRDIWENELYFFSFILPVNSPSDHSSVASVDREYTKGT
jgi:hypothetical protein